MGSNMAVFGIYSMRTSAETAVDALKNAGFDASDISVLLPDGSGSQEIAHTKASKAPEGAATGAGTGLVIGGALGWLVGIGALAIPGVGPFIAAGPLVAALAGIGIGGTVGGVSGALIGFGIPEYEAKRYETSLKSGGILLSVHVDDSDWRARAEQILRDTGAHDVAATSEVKGDKQASKARRSHDHSDQTHIL